MSQEWVQEPRRNRKRVFHNLTCLPLSFLRTSICKVRTHALPWKECYRSSHRMALEMSLCMSETILAGILLRHWFRHGVFFTLQALVPLWERSQNPDAVHVLRPCFGSLFHDHPRGITILDVHSLCGMFVVAQAAATSSSNILVREIAEEVLGHTAHLRSCFRDTFISSPVLSLGITILFAHTLCGGNSAAAYGLFSSSLLLPTLLCRTVIFICATIGPRMILMVSLPHGTRFLLSVRSEVMGSWHHSNPLMKLGICIASRSVLTEVFSSRTHLSMDRLPLIIYM